MSVPPEPENQTGDKVKGVKEKRIQNLQSTKDEIEDLMGRISEEIKHIDIEKGVTKPPSPLADTQRENFESDLAKSTLKGFTQGKDQLKFIKTAIRSSMKKTTSPRFLLKSNTITSFQV
jgi:hypothetical protein